MTNKEEALRMALDALDANRRTHYYCEDTWYSCPQHEDGCANDSVGDECNCGADKVNAEIDKAITAIREALAQPEQEPVAWLHNGKLHEFDPSDWATGPVTPLYPSAQMTWIKVTEQLPEHGGKALVTYVSAYTGKPAIVVGIYYERFKEESFGCDHSEYREEDDTHYICEGWYEQQRNWDDCASIFIHEGVVTHWAPLPETPKEN